MKNRLTKRCRSNLRGNRQGNSARKGVVALGSALLVAQSLVLAGCARKPVSKPADTPKPASRELTVPATEAYVRLIGRTCEGDGVTWLPQSGSAVEFAASGTRLSIEVVGDESVTSEADLCPRFAVLVDGEVVLDDMLTERTRTVEVFATEAQRDATVEVIHLTEAQMGAIGVASITVESAADCPVAPTKAKDLRVEFVGDSITCAYGVESSSVNEPFTTMEENFMKSYAYLAAEELDADYETVCYSGYGVVSGWSAGFVRNEDMLVPSYYDVVARGYDGPWDFAAHPNDVVVVNLGTNDFSYTGTDEERMGEFTNAYTSFLMQIRACNPEALIVCTMGTMGCEELYPCVEQAVEDFGRQTGDERIACYLSERIDEATEGVGTMGHPTEATQQRSAHVLAEVIREELERERS